MNIYKKGITKNIHQIYPLNLHDQGLFSTILTPIFLLKRSKRSPEKASMPIKKALISEYIILESIKSFIK